MERVAVVGAGMMGQGIAEVFAANGYPVQLYELRQEVLDQVHQRARANFKVLGVDEKATENISLHCTLESGVSGANIVFENVTENLEVKQNLFAEMEKYTGKDCVLASNTSVMPITQIGEKCRDRFRVLGTHWWNPPYLIPLVEVVQTEFSDIGLVHRTIDLLNRAGKVAVHVKRDVPGFVANRMQHALWREAVSIVEHGICDAETVDMCVKNSFGLRLPVLAPLENADLIGLDLTLAIHNTILSQIEAAPDPSPYLKDKVAIGELGMKTGKGFYEGWTPEKMQAVRTRLSSYLRAVAANGLPRQ
jgi:3-hydroxybutyryl-CoA dehydrogenase